MFTRAAGREGRCRQTSLACVGSARSVPATPGLPRSRRVCFPRLHCSGSRLLCGERALSRLHFPGLSRSGSGFPVPHKGLGWACVLCLPVRATQAARSRLGARCVCSGELVSSCDPPDGCQTSRISGSLWLETGSLFAVW